MSEKRFEKDCDENVCSFDYSTLDTYYEYNDSNEEIIEWNKHSSNAQYRNLKHIAEILNIKQMRLESLMKHREEIGKLFDRIDEQQATISKLEEENRELRLELETHKHPLWSTREAERKVNKLADSLAEEVKKNGLLNEEINQLRIENMRLKKKGGDGDMTPNDDFIKGLEQLRKGLDSFKHNLEVAVEQCNETLKRLKEEYDL